MTRARQEILGRVRAALADRPSAPEPKWVYGAPVSTGDHDVVERFIERAADYRATVVRVDADAVGSAVAEALSAVRATSVVGDALVQSRWGAGDGVTWISEDGLDARQLDGVDAVVTTATVAIANTGTIVLDHGPGQGRRALSLIPDVHVCVVESGQIVTDVPEAVSRLVDIGSHTRPLTWISGPSATSDIELDRVEGVHGPRTLYVIVAG
ncbi:lactate utilization protein C [Mycolicibacterium sp. CH28]|uniref:LutC/YkgG family protein n=1 Tax=Mycolicibacterium sp. CH28 TaxID=2512237 RepID=UPI001081E484|nr:LUD domain-containing protein [Mycolicibacterium sp. CH28]TGD90701.1 lactate utilization protein C [Mycolicibacterium sp. CH28]